MKKFGFLCILSLAALLQFFSLMVAAGELGITISGQIVTAQGMPVSGLPVVVSRGTDFETISATDKEGRFQLMVPEGGSYGIRALFMDDDFTFTVSEDDISQCDNGHPISSCGHVNIPTLMLPSNYFH